MADHNGRQGCSGPARPKRLALAGCLVALAALSLATQQAGAAMNLPDGIENILGFVPRSSFQCERDGYFGDTDNDCRLFHLCQRQVGANGRQEWRHWTYACGNQTMFNQLTLTCAFVDEAIPCRHASQFQYLNEVIHRPAEPFLTDADVTSGFSYYSNRVMSDGARQRAFQDTQLLAQIGGQQQRQQEQAASLGSPTFAGQHQEAGRALEAPFRHQASFATHQPGQLVAAALPQQHQHQSQPQNQVNLIENHSFQLQHQQEGPALQSSPSSQFQAQFPAQFQPLNGNNLGAFQQQQGFASASTSASSSQRQAFSAPPPSTTTITPTTRAAGASFAESATAPTVGSQNKPEGANLQQSQARQQNSQFEFSITTNHQAGAPSEPATLLVSQPPPQPQLAEFKFPLSPAPTTTTAATTSAASTTETSGNIWTVQPSGQQSTTLPSAIFTFTSTQRLQLAQPSQATVAVAAQPQTSTTTVGAQQQPSMTTRAPAREAAVRQARRLSGAGSGSRQRVEQVGFERAHAGFRSIRLSSQQARRSPGETPIVMRKNPQMQSSGLQVSSLPGAQVSAASGPAPGELLVASSQVPWSTGGDFWRRSFVSQLTAPKFESMLLRRRL